MLQLADCQEVGRSSSGCVGVFANHSRKKVLISTHNYMLGDLCSCSLRPIYMYADVYCRLFMCACMSGDLYAYAKVYLPVYIQVNIYTCLYVNVYTSVIDLHCSSKLLRLHAYARMHGILHAWINLTVLECRVAPQPRSSPATFRVVSHFSHAPDAEDWFHSCPLCRRVFPVLQA
jgi:hypothetical protein